MIDAPFTMKITRGVVMELRHLRYFQAVAQELHFGKAAAKLCIEPSPLSRAIKDLESELGVCLIVRNARHSELTKHGEYLLKRINNIFKIIEETKNSFIEHPDYRQRILKIAVSDEIDIVRFSEMVRSFRERNPKFNVEITQTTFHEQLNGIENHKYDFGFCINNSIKKREVFIKKIWEEPLVVLLPLRHPLLDYQELSIQKILKYPLIYFDPELYSGYHYQIKLICNAAKVQPKIVEYAKTFEMMLALVGAGYGLSLVTSNKLKYIKSNIVVSRRIRHLKRNPTIKSYIIYSGEKYYVNLQKDLFKSLQNKS